MSEPRRYQLKQPVTVTFRSSSGERQEQLTELTLRTEIKAKDLRAIDGHDGDVAKAIAMIARLSGRSIAEIDELGAEDFGELAELIDSFTMPGRKTGDGSSPA